MYISKILIYKYFIHLINVNFLINLVIDSINSSIEKIDVFLNEKDHNAVTKYLTDKKLELPFNLSQDTSLNRGDIIIKAGSIEVREIVDKKVKYSKSINLEPAVKNVGNKETLVLNL